MGGVVAPELPGGVPPGEAEKKKKKKHKKHTGQDAHEGEGPPPDLESQPHPGEGELASSKKEKKDKKAKKKDKAREDAGGFDVPSFEGMPTAADAGGWGQATNGFGDAVYGLGDEPGAPFGGGAFDEPAAPEAAAPGWQAPGDPQLAAFGEAVLPGPPSALGSSAGGPSPLPFGPPPFRPPPPSWRQPAPAKALAAKISEHRKVVASSNALLGGQLPGQQSIPPTWEQGTSLAAKPQSSSWDVEWALRPLPTQQARAADAGLSTRRGSPPSTAGLGAEQDPLSWAYPALASRADVPGSGTLRNDRRDDLIQTLAEEIKQLKEYVQTSGIAAKAQIDGAPFAQSSPLQLAAFSAGAAQDGAFARRWGGDLASEVSRSLDKVPAGGGFASSSTGGSDNGRGLGDALPWGPRPTKAAMSNLRNVNSPQGVIPGAPEDSRWAPEPAQLARYATEFEALDEDRGGFVEGQDVRGLLERSGLPTDTLKAIWVLADADCDGRLSRSEFVCALHLAHRCSNEDVEVPPRLPLALAALAAGHAAPAAATPGWASLPALWPSPQDNSPDMFPQQFGAGGDADGWPGAAAGLAAPPDSARAPSSWEPAPAELNEYRRMFEQEVPAGGLMSGEQARQILEGSELPISELSSIYALSDRDQDGELALPEFLCAMTLVARRRQNLPMVAELPRELLEACFAAGRPAALPALAGDTTWTPSPEELARYQDMLLHLTGGGAVVSHDEGRQALEQSGLPPADLSRIWQLSDVDQDGDLAAGEFFCAMTLAARRRDGAELPVELPEELLELAAAGLASPGAGAAPAAGAPSDWQLTAEELQRYLEYFEQLSGGASTVAPERAQDFLAGSGLPPQELTYIWGLLDASQVGYQEFVCAMALADRRRRGQNLPGELPEELALQLQAVPGQHPAPAAASLEGLEEYRAIFRGASQGSDFVDGAAAKDVLEKSGLPVEDLMKIWFLSDSDKDGRLSESEFVYAMALTNACRQGEPVPPELPPELMAAAAAMS